MKFVSFGSGLASSPLYLMSVSAVNVWVPSICPQQIPRMILVHMAVKIRGWWSLNPFIKAIGSRGNPISVSSCVGVLLSISYCYFLHWWFYIFFFHRGVGEGNGDFPFFLKDVKDRVSSPFLSLLPPLL